MSKNTHLSLNIMIAFTSSMAQIICNKVKDIKLTNVLSVNSNKSLKCTHFMSIALVERDVSPQNDEGKQQKNTYWHHYCKDGKKTQPHF